MEWALESRPFPVTGIPFYNLHYLYACPSPADPTMVWGSTVDAQGLEAYIQQVNLTSPILITAAHVLLQAVGRTLAEFPQLNRRVVGRRIYAFRDVNVRIMTYDRQREEVDVVLIRHADHLNLVRIAQLLWRSQTDTARGVSLDYQDKQWLRRWPERLLRWAIRGYLSLDRNFRLPKVGRIDRISSAPVLVNYFGFAAAPSLHAYKPSSFPDGSSHLNVTMGRIEPRPVVVNGQVEVRRIAPLFVRADHRLADPFVLARFVSTLQTLLQDPARMETENERTHGAAAEASAA
jgi:hypothetical protein